MIRWVMMLVVLWVVMYGGPPAPPPGLGAANARLEDGAATFSPVILVVQCRTDKEYAVQAHGDWEDHWHMITCDVLRTE